MPIPQEVDDLEREIVRLKQEIGKGKAKLVTLQSKVNTSQKSVDYCTRLQELCALDICKMKALPLVVLQDFREIKELQRSNNDRLVKHKNDVMGHLTALENLRRDIPMMQNLMTLWQKQLAQWGVVLRFER